MGGKRSFSPVYPWKNLRGSSSSCSCPFLQVTSFWLSRVDFGEFYVTKENIFCPLDTAFLGPNLSFSLSTEILQISLLPTPSLCDKSFGSIPLQISQVPLFRVICRLSHRFMKDTEVRKEGSCSNSVCILSKSSVLDSVSHRVCSSRHYWS